MDADRRYAHAVLGAMILDPDALSAALAWLRPDAMTGQLGTVLEALRTLAIAGEDASLLPLGRYLEAHEKLAAAGGWPALSLLVESACARSNLEAACRIVNAEAKRRALVGACRSTLADADQPGEPDELLDRHEQQVSAIRDRERGAGLEHISAILPRLALRVASGLATGFRGLDSLVGGLEPGQLFVVAARPGVGKTAVAVAVSDRAARLGNPVMFASIEMSAPEIARRFLALHGATMHDARDYSLVADSASRQVETMPLHIAHEPSPTLFDLSASLRRVKGCALLVVDYLQLLRASRRDVSRAEQVDEIARGLKALAKTHNVPVLALAQVNRSPELGRGTPRAPMLSDLRESGGIENNADVVVFLHREKYYDPLNDEAEFIVAKQRQGPLGVATLRFVRNHATFVDA